MPPKRPQGLNKSAKNKKPKKSTDESPSDPTPDLTIALDDEVDAEDELNQLYGLFSTYQSSDEGSPKLVYGLIHECDRLLRNSKETLPAKFHDIYAKSLLDLARFVDQDERKKAPKKGETSEDFIIAAIERANTGIESYPDSIDLLSTRSRGKVRLVNDKLQKISPDEGWKAATEFIPEIKDAIKDFEGAEDLLLKNGKTYIDFTKDHLIVIENLLELADSLAVFEEEERAIAEELFADEADSETKQTPLEWSKSKFQKTLQGEQKKILEWTKQKFQNILNINSSKKGKSKDHNGTSLSLIRWANKGMGQYYLALAAPLLAKYESGDDDEDEEEDEEEDEDDDDDSEPKLTPEELQTATSTVSKAVEYLLKAESEDEPENYSIIAEALIALANLSELESDEQKRLYKEATFRLKKSQRLGYGDYHELIADLEG